MELLHCGSHHSRSPYSTKYVYIVFGSYKAATKSSWHTRISALLTIYLKTEKKNMELQSDMELPTLAGVRKWEDTVPAQKCKCDLCNAHHLFKLVTGPLNCPSKSQYPKTIENNSECQNYRRCRNIKKKKNKHHPCSFQEKADSHDIQYSSTVDMRKQMDWQLPVCW